MEKVVVIGAGSWGTALATVLSDNNHDVVLWELNEEKAKEIQKTRENKKFLPNVILKNNIYITSETENLLKDAKYVIFSVPSQVLRDVIKKFSPQITENTTIINTAKGIEVGSNLRLSEVIKEEIIGKYHKNIITLCGPTHAEEVGQKIPTAIVAAGNLEKSKLVQSLFNNDKFRVYINDDIIGVEMGAALKNVLAIANGILDGLNLGDNTKAALITRGLVEMVRLGTKLGANKETFYGLTGIGDLIVTATSKHSRNRYVGEEIGKGKKLKEILDSMFMVAEGVETVKAVHKLKEIYNVEMPILDGVYKILFEELEPKSVLFDLMNRKTKNEIDI